MCCRIGQWIDDFQLLNDRAGPSVRHDHRQRVRQLRTHVNEVDVDTVDLGRELRQRVEGCLDLAPVVVRGPVRASFCTVASCTPCDWSGTISLSGHRVAATRAFQIRERLVWKMDTEGLDGIDTHRCRDH